MEAFQTPLLFCSSTLTRIRSISIFLDIDLGGMDGMALARKIQARRTARCRFSFLTNHREYVFEGYEVQAFRYLLKPVTEDTLFPLLDELQTMRRQEKPHLLLSWRGDAEAVPLGSAFCGVR